MTGIGTPPDQHEEELADRVNHGLRWSATNQLVTRTLTFAAGIVVLRVLSVEQVGAFGAAFAIVTLVLAVNELGLIPTLVQWRDRPEHARRTAYTLALASSAIWFALIVLLAPLFARGLGIPGLTEPLRILALTILVDGVTSVPHSVVTREFRQRGLAFAEAVGMVVQIGVSISLAFAGTGAAALAWGQTLSNAAAGVIIVVAIAPRVVPGWDTQLVRPLLRFSTPMAAAALVRDGGVNADSVVVGGALGATQLGYYQFAFNLGSLPINSVGATVRRVSLAAFARLAHDRERMRAALERSTMFLGAVTVPMVALIAALASPLVTFLYGSKWEPAVDAVRLLVVLGGFRVIAMLLIDACVAAGRPQVELQAYGIWLGVLLPLVWFGAITFGIVGAAVVHVAVMLAVVFPIVLHALGRAGLQPRRALVTMARPLTAGVIGGVVAYLASLAVTGAFVQLVVGGTAGVVVMVACTLPGNHDLSWLAIRRWREQVA